MSVRSISGPINRLATKRLSPVNRVRGYSTPAPVKGWNARDALANMAEDEAIRLDNWFPEESSVQVRRGFATHATAMMTAVESLMAWHGPNGHALFGATVNSVWDVTLAGGVGAASITGCTNGRWQHTMFGTAAGNYLYIVNGADAPRYYDGSTWTTPAFTGGIGADMIHVNSFKRRLFFVEKNSLSFWYLPVVSVSGLLTEFDLAPLCELGGYLVAMGTWTRDSGNGVDDLAVFVTSRGEVIIFQGDDPTFDSTWTMVGVFRIGDPIGRRCMVKVGADLIIMTADGFSQISRFLVAGRSSEKAAISDRISGAVNEAVRSHRATFGWQPILYPDGNMVIFNIPTGIGAVQFVSNSTTGAWCRFTNMDAFCWEILEHDIYFGGTGTVYQADTGLDDDGEDVETDVKSAFSYFGRRGAMKRYGMLRPNLTVDGTVSVALTVNVDFEDVAPTDTPSFAPGEGTEWDAGEWDTFYWAAGETVSQEWQSVYGLGHCAAMRMRTVSQNGTIKWNSTDWKIELPFSEAYI